MSADQYFYNLKKCRSLFLLVGEYGRSVKKGFAMGNTAGFKIWRSLNLGVGPKSADEFRQAFTTSHCNIGGYADEMLGNSAFDVSSGQNEIGLIVATVPELGFPDGAPSRIIFNRIINELGLPLCSSNVGPKLRLEYLNQPEGEHLIVVMNPISDLDGTFRLFSVQRDECGLWLHARCCVIVDGSRPEQKFFPGCKLVIACSL